MSEPWLAAADVARLAPKARPDIVDALVDAFNSGEAAAFGIATKAHAAHWLTQIIFESDYLKTLEENLRYSVLNVQRVFPKLAPRARELAGNPEGLGNAAYGGRLGNGPEGTGDGWRFRGGGLIQETGKSNYVVGANEERMSVLAYAQLLHTDATFAVRRALRWWQRNGINRYATDDSREAVQRCSRAVNRGNGNSPLPANGEVDRIKLFQQVWIVLRGKHDGLPVT